jgi:hypothetical protein
MRMKETANKRILTTTAWINFRREISQATEEILFDTKNDGYCGKPDMVRHAMLWYMHKCLLLNFVEIMDAVNNVGGPQHINYNAKNFEAKLKAGDRTAKFLYREMKFRSGKHKLPWRDVNISGK